MARKIKVVEVENVEEPETVETSSMKRLSPMDETPETVETEEPSSTPIADEPQIQEETPEELVREEVEPPKEVKSKKQEDKNNMLHL